ncbi:hypothetical protein [Acidocella sp.]|uniref:hypothetical protein n=1 Tax=Acidocella sp. TaxID=50710 RepID=UPI0026172F80|nr:hypothetical protein [Acidocella sp.]
MSESESEDEILDRIEAALRKIASLPAGARLHDGAPDAQPGEGAALGRAALTMKLDDIIGRLRAGLDNAPPRAGPGE